MDNEKKYYSASDLAALLEVPRTTVNDWLKKYDRYIDFEMRGRRKVYTDASLEVLRMVSAARDAGTASADLEKELSSSCAVRPEISSADDFDQQESPAGETASSGSNLPAVKFDLPAFFAEFEKREQLQERTRKRGFLWVSVLLVLLLAAACGTLFLLGQLLTLRESGKALEARLASSQEEMTQLRKRSEKEFQSLARQMETANRSGKAQAALFRRQLADQQKRFDRIFDRLEKREKMRMEELRELKKENAGLKTQLQVLERQSVVRQAKLKQDAAREKMELRKQINKLQREVREIQNEKSALKRELENSKKELSAVKEQKKSQIKNSSVKMEEKKK